MENHAAVSDDMATGSSTKHTKVPQLEGLSNIYGHSVAGNAVTIYAASANVKKKR